MTTKTQKPKNVKTNKLKGENNEALPPELDGEVQQNTGNDLDADFEAFDKKTSSFVPEQNNTSENTGSENTNTSGDPGEMFDLGTTIKMRMLVGLCCMLLAGFNTFLFNKMKGTAVPFKEMELDEDERESLLPYLDDPRIIEFINKIPSWLIGLIHVEYMFYKKHSDVAVNYIKPKKVIKMKVEKKGEETNGN